MVHVTKTFLPPLDEYIEVLNRAWDKGWITNNGDLVQELEGKLKEYLGVKHLLFCSNGTIALQMAIKALGITKEIITTPFSYVATANAIAWEGCTPVFADIDPVTFTIDPVKIEAALTPNTEAILATHVYGFPCHIHAIQALADRYGLRVIYDGAHAFGSRYQGLSLLAYGDISTCSFHATKLFHTGEGGCIITDDDAIAEKLMLMRQFGHVYDDYYEVGINGKNSELHAAMGLAIWPHFNEILAHKKEISGVYKTLLPKEIQTIPEESEFDFTWNHSYFPVLFADAQRMLSAKYALAKKDYFPRQYFYPSLNTLPFWKTKVSCLISENIAERVLCLPNGPDVDAQIAQEISRLISQVV